MGIKIADLIDCTLCTHYDKKEDICNASRELNIKLIANGLSYASKCPEFRSIRDSITNETLLENALEYMLSGNSEFTMLSIRTGKKLRYRLDRRQNVSKNDDFIYWVNTESSNGTLMYAGVLYFDYKDKKFKYGKGARGNLTSSDQRINSLLFVLNKLYNEVFNIELKIYNTGKCGVCNSKLNEKDSAFGICTDCLCSYRYIKPAFLNKNEFTEEDDAGIDIDDIFNKSSQSKFDDNNTNYNIENKENISRQNFDDSYDPWFNSDSDVWG